MFITKRKLEELIAKAVHEKEKEMWLNERIARVDDEAIKRHLELERRVSRIERMHEVEPDPECTANPIGYVG